MRISIAEGTVESHFKCDDCGEVFDYPTEDHLCPYCYNQNIQTVVVDKPLQMVKKFYGRNGSVSAAIRDEHPIEDCICFIICMVRYGYSGYWDGRGCNPDKDMATIFVSQWEAERKIKYSNMTGYWDAYVEKVKLIDNHIV